MKTQRIIAVILISVIVLSSILCLPVAFADKTEISELFDEKNSAIYKNTINSLNDRLLNYGYARTSYDLEDGSYVNEGMFVRDSSVQALAHISLREFDNARKILGYIAGVHATYFDTVRASRCLSELENIPDYTITFSGNQENEDIFSKNSSSLYPLITIENKCEASQEIIIPENSSIITTQNESYIYRTLTGLKVFMSSSMTEGTVYLSLYKGKDFSDRQLIGKIEMASSDISNEGEWLTLIFGLPYEALIEDGNFYLNVRVEVKKDTETDDAILDTDEEEESEDFGSIVWYGMMDENPKSESILSYYEEKIYKDENPTPVILTDSNYSKVKGVASYVGLVSDIHPLDDREQTETSFVYIYAWLKFAESAPYNPDNDDFIKRSYPLVKKFADYFFTTDYLKYGGTYYNEELKLLLNPNLEHTRVDAKEGLFTSVGGTGMWEAYDLLTNVFASQALYMLSEYAKSQDEDPEYYQLCLQRAENIKEGINENLTVVFDNKKIYAELISANRYHNKDDDYLLEGLSYINYAPIGANWYGIDDDIMKNTISKYQEYAYVEFTCNPENPCYDATKKYYLPSQVFYINNSYYDTGVVSGTTVGKLSGTHVSGRLISWVIMACERYGDYTQMANLFLYIGKHSYKGYYPETWQPNDAMSDMANQIMASWMVYAVSETFFASDTVSVVFVSNDATGTPPFTKQLIINSKFIIPESSISKSGSIFEGWSDGKSIYKPGDEYSLQDNPVVFTPVFRSVFVPSENEDTKYGPYIALGAAVIGGAAAFLIILYKRSKSTEKE